MTSIHPGQVWDNVRTGQKTTVLTAPYTHLGRTYVEHQARRKTVTEHGHFLTKYRLRSES